MRSDDSSHSDQDIESPAIDLSGLFHTLRRKWWMILGSLLITVGLATIYILRTPKTYESETVVQVEQSSTKVMGDIKDLNSEDLKAQELLKTIEKNIVGSQVLVKVIERLALTPEQLGIKLQPGQTISQPQLAGALQSAVGAKLQRGTRLISVTAQNTDPVLAQKIADAIIADYIRNDAAQKLGVAGEANRYLLEEASRLKAALSEAEQAAQNFKDAHPDVALDDSQTFIDQKLLGVTQRVNDARSLRIGLEADAGQIQSFKNALQGDMLYNALLGVKSIKNSPAVLQLQQTIAEEEAAFATLKQRYLPKHPKYIEGESRLQKLRGSLGLAILQAAEAQATEVESARESEKALVQVMDDQNRAKLANDRLMIPYNSLSREVMRNQNLYDSVQQRLKETALTTGMDDNKIRINTPASLPYKPVKPKPKLVLAAAVVGGLLMGFCLCFAFSLADSSLKTLDQAETALGINAVGAIPLGSKAEAEKRGLSVTLTPNSALAEAFRTLRTALSLLGPEKDFRSILFTSGVPGEGKSFCSVNHAISLAQLGRRTLLIDADLRLPVIEPLFFEQPKEKGLSGLLQGEYPLEQAYYPTNIPNLYVLPSGRRAQNPAELIANSNVPALVKNILKSFDRVVFDSAPVHAVSDTLLIAQHVSAVCLVVHAGKTPLKVVQRAIQKLTDANARPAGFILNRLPQNSGGYYYHYSGGTYGDKVYGSPEAYAITPAAPAVRSETQRRRSPAKTAARVAPATATDEESDVDAGTPAAASEPETEKPVSASTAPSSTPPGDPQP
ncbi:MAG TPA: polysaccharide biosynthesis tyrosine autokinase [Chthoniobacterales bacterium]|jgi:capsular exopolysaccharide synthesis family protein